MQHSFYSSDSAFKRGKTENQPHQNLEPLMLQLINTQFVFTQHLLLSQHLLAIQLKKKAQTSESSGSNSFQDSKGSLKQLNPSQEQDYLYSHDDKVKESDVRAQKRSRRGRRLRNKVMKMSLFYESQPEGQQKTQRKSETKNIIKNFSKSLFNFIKMQKETRVRILQETGCCEESFMTQLAKQNGNVNTIRQLRNLWTGNTFCQEFRMMSQYFCRKRYRHYIFNSRVLNYSIHLKYLKEFLSVLKRPEQLLALKRY